MKDFCGMRISFLRIPGILILLLGGGIPLASIAGCFSFQISEKKIQKTFENWNMETPSYKSYSWRKGEIFYAEVGSPNQPHVILVHGSPGSWDNFLSFFGNPFLRDHAHLIAVDRPGFGKSRGSGPISSLKAQAEALGPLLDNQQARKKAILVGHSLGGPVVAQMAVDFPEEVGGLVLVAPSISPDLEELRWYNNAARSPLIRWILPRALRHSNQEIIPLKQELEQLEPQLAELQIPVIVIQGEKDNLVPHQKADFVEKAFVQAQVKIEKYPELNHFILWTQPELIERALQLLVAPEGESVPSSEIQL